MVLQEQIVFGLGLTIVTLIAALGLFGKFKQFYPAVFSRHLSRVSILLYAVSLLIVAISPMSMLLSMPILSNIYLGASETGVRYTFPFVYREQALFCLNSHVLCDKPYLFLEMDSVAILASVVAALRVGVGILDLATGGEAFGSWSLESSKRRLLEGPKSFYHIVISCLLLSINVIFIPSTSNYNRVIIINQMIHEMPQATVILLTIVFTIGVTCCAETILIFGWRFLKPAEAAKQYSKRVAPARQSGLFSS